MGHKLYAQEPQQWPQDDPYPQDNSDQGQPQGYAAPQYQQVPQTYPQQGYPQGYPQQTYPQGYPQQGDESRNAAPDYGQPQYGEGQFTNPAQPMNADQLEQLVAPIALYPDAVLAQILAASTYPAQVAAADQWLRGQAYAPPDQIAAGASAQTGWDPSVKALTAYPQVLSMMDQNLQWTTALGNAYYNQPQDLLQTVQVLRERAQQAGNLQSTPQEQVLQSPGYIALAPANPDVVYVPTYNPWVVYGAQIAPYPNYSPLGVIGAALGTAVQYGLGFGVSAFTHTPFGLLSWGLDWLANAVLFNHSDYYSHSMSVRDWGLPHGGPRAFGRGAEMARYGDRYGRGGYGFRNQQRFNRGEGRYPIARSGQGFDNHYGNGLNRGSNFGSNRPSQGYDNRYAGGINRGYAGYGRAGYGTGYRTSEYGNARGAFPQQGAYGRPQAPIARAQQYGNRAQPYGGRAQTFASNEPRSSNSSGFNQRSVGGYGGGRGMGYAAPTQAYRTPTPSFGRQGFSAGRQGSAFAGNFGQSQHSGGFHLFGGGHGSQSYGGGHSFSGGGHSFGGGGHSFGGGGHSFGGGHSGGGHSGGGHSGGGHSGGGHGHHR